MSVVARRASSDDLDDLERMDGLLREYMSGLRGGPLYLLSEHRGGPPRDSYSADLNDDDKLVVIGLIDGYAAGFAVGAINQLEGDFTLAEITEIFVDRELREVGVGGAMMSMIMQWARSRGAEGIDSRAMPGDRNTKNFFESNGLVARAIYVHRDLRQ